MGDVADKFFPGIGIAALSALTYLAYKHPHAYRKILPAILALFVVALLVITAWDLGTINGLGTLLPLIQEGRNDEALALIANSQILSEWIVAVVGCVTFYLISLVALPFFLGDHKPVDKNHNKE